MCRPPSGRSPTPGGTCSARRSSGPATRTTPSGNAWAPTSARPSSSSWGASSGSRSANSPGSGYSTSTTTRSCRAPAPRWPRASRRPTRSPRASPPSATGRTPELQIFGDSIRFGVHSGPQNTTFEGYRDLWLRAEELGYEWVSDFDHFLPIHTDPAGPQFEGLTLLSAMAAHTSRVRCGMLVLGVTYRHPAVVANIAATIDHVSGGR